MIRIYRYFGWERHSQSYRLPLDALQSDVYQMHLSLMYLIHLKAVMLLELISVYIYILSRI